MTDTVRDDKLLGIIADWTVCEDCCSAIGGEAVRRVSAGFLAALRDAGYAIVKLPEPGQLSDHHADSDTVWYVGQWGEIVLTAEGDIYDSEGNDLGVNALREQAAATLAAIDRFERQ